MRPSAMLLPMTTLYIIGNGFDLSHGLPTDYGSFYKHAKESLDEMDAYYISGGPVGKPWHDFENCLGTYSWELFYDAFNDIDVTSESFRLRDAYCLEDELAERSGAIVERIEELFREWVSDIDVSDAQAKFAFDPNSMFLTFNYTETLQEVYGVSNNDVLYIHGNAAAFDKLIFGHGESREEEPEIDANGDSNRTMFTDAENAAKYPFYAFQKPVVETIKEHGDYFFSLRGVTKTVVIGHSLNDIDLPYFQEVAKNTTGCNWLIYCHRESDVEHHKRQLIRCGVNACRIETCAYS